MANTKISALTATTTPTWSEEFVYAYNNANGKITLNTMKSFIAWWGWSGVTTLNADANIWELAGWFYETEYELYYKSWEKVPTISTASATRKQLLFVSQESNWARGYLTFNSTHTTTNRAFASFWYSASSSDWVCRKLDDREWALKAYNPVSTTTGVDSIWYDNLTQIITAASGTSTLELRTGTNAPYPWVTYTILFESVSSAYTVALWTGVTNPFGITLPSSSNKKSVITILITSTATAIITSCVIEP